MNAILSFGCAFAYLYAVRTEVKLLPVPPFALPNVIILAGLVEELLIEVTSS